jgi:hypothetical protein
VTDVEKIKEYAACLMSIPDIAVLMGVEVDELSEAVADRSSAVSRAYYLGKAQTTYEIRRQEVELAKTGSPMAVELVSDYLIEQSQHEL